MIVYVQSILCPFLIAKRNQKLFNGATGSCSSIVEERDGASSARQVFWVTFVTTKVTKKSFKALTLLNNYNYTPES
jgi:hypothetical protein